MLSCETPGVSIARSIQRRDATGRSWICWLLTLVATFDCVVSTSGVSAATVTDSLTVAGLSVTLIVTDWSMTSESRSCVSVLNPGSSVTTV